MTGRLSVIYSYIVYLKLHNTIAMTQIHKIPETLFILYITIAYTKQL